MDEISRLKSELKALNAEYAKIRVVPAEKRGEFNLDTS